jgi:hypothetical protein
VVTCPQDQVIYLKIYNEQFNICSKVTSNLFKNGRKCGGFLRKVAVPRRQGNMAEGHLPESLAEASGGR